MTVQYCSDLHLEFEYNKHFMLTDPLIPSAEILILAGDVCLLKSSYLHDDFFDFVSNNWKVTYWLPGNHEYYYSDVAERGNSFCEAIRPNVFLVNNHAVIHAGVRLLFTTLWSYISQLSEKSVARGMSDFTLINYQNRKLVVPDYNRLHLKSLAFLEEQFADRGMKTIVVTHHVPTLQNYPSKYINSPINDGFVSQLDELIESSHADYWIYGHHHASIRPFCIGDTTLITNQLGYVHAAEPFHFDPAAIVTI